MSVDFFTTELQTEPSSPVGSSSPDRLVPVTYQTSREPPSYVLEAAKMPPSFSIRLERGDGYVIVTDRPTGIFGQGEDVLAAVQDFQAAVSEHLDVLERQSALSEELTWQLEYLRARVRRETHWP
jgi:hypothetical protein